MKEAKTQFKQVGDTVHVAGPSGKFFYKENGLMQVFNQEQQELLFEGKYSKFGFIAGGCGITPPFQLIKYLTDVEKNKEIKLRLLFANKTQKDILLKKELDDLQAKNANFKAFYILDQVNPKLFLWETAMELWIFDQTG